MIDSRVKGSGCPECLRQERMAKVAYSNAEEEMVFKNNVIAYYANIANAEVIMGSDDIIGVPLDVYFPALQG